MTNKPTAKPKHDGGDEESTKRHVYVEPGVQIDLVKNFREEYKTAQDENTAHNKRVLLWTKISAGLVLVVIFIYYFQLRAMIATVTATRQASERAQRAWLTIHALPSTSITANPFRVENSGSTPARRVIVRAWVELLPITEEADLSEHSPTKDGSVGYEFEIGELTPKDHFEDSAFRRKRGDNPRFPPIWPFTDDEIRDLKEAKKYVIWYARADYDDVFHVRHWTKYCTWGVGTGAPSTPTWTCSQYNQSDDTDEP